MQSHIFKSDKELMEFIQKEVMKYVGCYDPTKVLFSYNRLTVEELSQEVMVRLLRSVDQEFNKKYVRQAVMYVCIDEYRRFRLHDLPEDLEEPETDGEEFELVERLMQVDRFTPQELKVIELLMLGHRNPEIREILKIPKMTYYTLLNRIKSKYLEADRPQD